MVLTAEEKNNLIEQIANLLKKYDYSYNTLALEEIVDEWATNKADLINAFKKHPKYIDGKFMIAFDKTYDREIDYGQVTVFSSYVFNSLIVDCVGTLPDEVRQNLDLTKAESNFPMAFDCLPYEIYRLFEFIFREYAIEGKTIEDEKIVNSINTLLPQAHAHLGEKWSRVINKICTYLGYNKHQNYNRQFAQFADALSPLQITRHTILSINPLDYLTMSFGNSWSSCHTIDKTNKRNVGGSTYQGCYSSGTMSYMLDPSSIVFYTTSPDYDGTDYWTQDKITRQMFHYGADKLIQGRLYPQDNDVSRDAYAINRNIVQELIASIFDFPNLWSVSYGPDRIRNYVDSYGTHYRDYTQYSNCTLSKVSGAENDRRVKIGHIPICIECGSIHDYEDNINCCSRFVQICAHCGRKIYDEDDVYWDEDTPYCENCVTYCDDCERYHYRENVNYYNYLDRYVCDGCINDHYVVCDHCDNYVYEEDYYTAHNGDYICPDCRDEYYTECDCCGELFLNDVIECFDYTDETLCPICLEKRKKEYEGDEE